MNTTAVLGRTLQTAAARSSASPAALAVNGVFYLMVTTVLGGLWSTAADASGGQIAGYSAGALVWYIYTSEASTIPIPIRLIEQTGADIGSGRVVVELLRPRSMLWLRVIGETGAMLPRLGVCAVLGIAGATVLGGAPPSATALLLAAPALIMALILNVVAQHLFAGAAFWVRDAKSGWFLYQKLVFVLGGMLLPLEVLPDSMEVVAKSLPFMAMSYVPARLASGHVEPELLLIQLFWLVVLSLAATWVFAAGQRRMVEVGG